MAYLPSAWIVDLYVLWDPNMKNQGKDLEATVELDKIVHQGLGSYW